MLGKKKLIFCYFLQLLESFQRSFPSLSFPPLPERGDFNIKDVLDSTYFFNWLLFNLKTAFFMIWRIHSICSINDADFSLQSGNRFALHRKLVYIRSEMIPVCLNLAAAESPSIVGQVVILGCSWLRGYKFGGQNTEFDHPFTTHQAWIKLFNFIMLAWNGYSMLITSIKVYLQESIWYLTESRMKNRICIFSLFSL